MMRDVLRWILPMAAAVGLAGCLDTEKVVHIKPDGSGFVEERLLMRREVLAMMQGMAEMAAQPGEGAGFRLLDRDRLTAEAAAMGPGVALVSAEALATPEGEGYVARYTFTDVNQLTLDQNPGDPAARDATRDANRPGAAADAGTGEAPAKKREALRFEFRKGDQPVLIVRSPRESKTPPGDAAAADKAPATLPEGPERQMALQMMQQMFKGMHMAVQVEVEGEILETNAAFRDGSRVTLVDIRFDQILADPERFERLALAQPEGIEEVKALLKDLPGVKVEPNDTVEIRFAPR